LASTGKTRRVADFCEHGFEAAAILFDRRAADLHLDDVIAALDIGAHFRAQCAEILARIVVATGGVDEHFRIGFCRRAARPRT